MPTSMILGETKENSPSQWGQNWKLWEDITWADNRAPSLWSQDPNVLPRGPNSEQGWAPPPRCNSFLWQRWSQGTLCLSKHSRRKQGPGKGRMRSQAVSPTTLDRALLQEAQTGQAALTFPRAGAGAGARAGSALNRSPWVPAEGFPLLSGPGLSPPRQGYPLGLIQTPQ